MKKLIESIDRIAEIEGGGKPADQVRSKEKITNKGGYSSATHRLVGASEAESADFVGDDYIREEGTEGEVCPYCGDEVDPMSGDCYGCDTGDFNHEGDARVRREKAGLDNEEVTDEAADTYNPETDASTGTQARMAGIQGTQSARQATQQPNVFDQERGELDFTQEPRAPRMPPGLSPAAQQMWAARQARQKVTAGRFDESADLVEELRAAFEDYVGDPYRENNVLPKKGAKPSKDEPKAKKAKREPEANELSEAFGFTPTHDPMRRANSGRNEDQPPVEKKSRQQRKREEDARVAKQTANKKDDSLPESAFDYESWQKSGGNKKPRGQHSEKNLLMKDPSVRATSNSALANKQGKIATLRDKLEKLSAALKGAKDARSLKEAPLNQTLGQPVQDQTIAKPGQVNTGPNQGTPAQPANGQVQVNAATGTTNPVKPAPGAPAITAQQATAARGAPTAAPVAGQQTPPAAGQAGGAPVATPGAPAPVPGNNNAATTPAEQMKGFIQTLANDPTAAKQLMPKLNTLK